MVTFRSKFFIYFLFFCSNAVFSDPVVNEEFSYYLIYPDNPSEIASELSKHSPIKENGKTFKGHTEWNVNWNYWWQTENGKCKINKVKTEVAIKYTMPKLASPGKNKDIEKKFNTYYSALLLHEKGHKESAVLAADEIENILLNLPEKFVCDELGILANKKAKNIIRKFNKKDIVYDYKTDHGRTQGAVID